MIDHIPTDLAAFLRQKQQLVYDESKAIAGRIQLRSLNQLRIGRLYATPHSELDPNRKKSGVYRIPAICLVKSCEIYDPTYILSYLPFEKAYASFDGDHALITLFQDASWTKIVANPVPYLNAMWEPSPTVECVRNENQWWKRYEFFKDAFE
jgi:hypothetical protein